MNTSTLLVIITAFALAFLTKPYGGCAIDSCWVSGLVSMIFFAIGLVTTVYVCGRDIAKALFGKTK